MPAIRHAARNLSPTQCFYQRRWARVHDVRFLASHQKPESRILEKYKDKLAQKAKEEGLSDIEQLKAAYQDKITELRKKAAVPGATAPLVQPQQATNAPFQPPPPPEPQTQKPVTSAVKASAESKAGIKTLSSFIDVEKTRELPHKEIEYLWRLRHASDPTSLCAVMTSEIYNRIAETARRHPQFILPLPRDGQGAEIHFLQWTFPSPTTATVLFTHLAEYKLRGEFSTPHTTVTHHLDLLDPNGVVLLQGSVLPDRGVSVDEGKLLLLYLQKFYGQTAEATPRRKLMKQFSQGDATFKVEELLEEAEKIP